MGCGLAGSERLPVVAADEALDEALDAQLYRTALETLIRRRQVAVEGAVASYAMLFTDSTGREGEALAHG